MGGGSFKDEDTVRAYTAYTASTVGKTTEEIYTSRKMDKDLDPKGVKVRESRDSPTNPKSTPVIVALDVTGSMGMLADAIARDGLGKLFTSILDRQPITDPHVMFMGVGDANFDKAPLQVSQFEADKRIIPQLEKLYIEHGGGGNQFESYNLPWYFAAFHTVHDSFEKRGKRGYLFTVGDEPAPQDLTQHQIHTFIGDTPQVTLSTKELLELAQRTYDVFHVVICQGDYYSHSPERVRSTWTHLLGQRVIYLEDYTKLPETIVAAIEVAEGTDAASAATGWGSAATETIVHAAVKNLPKGASRPLLGGPGA
jgi:hypothetical protein